MKNNTLFLFTMLTLFALKPAFAAFPVKQKSATTYAANTSANLRTNLCEHKLHKPSRFTNFVSNLFGPSVALNPVRRKSDTLGLLSLIFGIVGLATIFYYGTFLSIAAIILGAIGMRNKERFSLTGLILGITGLVLILVAVAVFAAFLAGAFI